MIKFLIVSGKDTLDLEAKVNTLVHDPLIDIKELGALSNSNGNWYLSLLLDMKVPKENPQLPKVEAPVTEEPKAKPKPTRKRKPTPKKKKETTDA